MELFELKLLFIKVRCLINVNKICGLLRNGSSTTKWVIHGKPSFLWKSHTQNFHPTLLTI